MNKKASAAALAVLLGLAVTAAAPGARAQGAQNAAAQVKRFGAAQSLYDQGAYTPAYQEFKALADETRSPNAELYVARCLRELGRLPEAHEALTLALRNATAKAETEPKYVSTRNAAAADLALLEPRVGKLVVAVADPPEGLSVTLNDAPLPREKVGVPVAASIGGVVVRVRAPGRADVERHVTLRGGETTTVAVALEAASGAAPAPITLVPVRAAEPADTAPRTGGGGRIAGFVVLGLGAAGMATFAGAGVTANSRYDTIRAACHAQHCTDPSFTAQIAGGRQLDVIADVGLGVGIAGLVGGALLVALGGPKAAPPGVTAWVAPGGGGFGMGGSF